VEPALHEDLRPLAFLLGTWRGEGDGAYPTTEPFRYREEMTFEHAGDAVLLYQQRSWFLVDDSPSHGERGFVRPGGPGRVELMLAHPLGVVEVAEGTVAGTTIDVVSTTVGVTSTGSAVVELRRSYSVDRDVLTYELMMAMRDVPLTHHLTGELRRVSG
jgi:hypothetical protein